MKYLNKKFSVPMNQNKKYDKNYDKIFGKYKCPRCNKTLTKSKRKNDMYVWCVCGYKRILGGKDEKR